MKISRLLIYSALCVLSNLSSAKAQVQIIQTYVGTGAGSSTGDGGPAKVATTPGPYGIAVDASDNLYITENGGYKVRRVDAITGVISTIVGTTTTGSSGDNGPATAAMVNAPSGVAFHPVTGDIYIVDGGNNKVRKIDAASGIITTVAGVGGGGGFSGDGLIATNAQLNTPRSVAVDASGNLYICDASNNRVRMVDGTTHIITTIAGVSYGGGPSYTGDGAAATLARLSGPRGILLDPAGNVIFGDFNNNRVRMVDMSTGIISTIVGNGSGTTSGDGSPATAAGIGGPIGLCYDASGQLYIAERSNNHVRVVDLTGNISTYAGIPYGGGGSFSGDGGPATAARLGTPVSVAMATNGHLYISDNGNNRIREVRPNSTPFFVGGTSQSLNVCSNSVANSLASVIPAFDTDAYQTLHWTIVTPAVNGTAVLSVTATSTGNTMTPSSGTQVYSPNTGYSGLDSFQIQISDGYDFSISTIYVNVNSYAGVISGPTLVCAGATLSLSESVTGGGWTSGNTAVATVDASGVVTALSVGTADISYTVSTAPCAAASAIQTVTVATTPSAGSITGPSSVCVGASVTLSNATLGGTWSISGGGTATITPLGKVNGALAGTAIVTYTINSFCGLTPTTTVMTINPLPAAGSITGPLSVCVAATVTMADVVSGGVWSYSNTTGSISPAGIVTGASSGSGIVSYSYTNVCGTANAVRAITVNAIPPAGVITGPSSVCATATITLSDPAPGGVWSASGPATVSSFGLVTGTGGGTAIITYRVGNACGNASATATVNVNGLPNPGTISGPSSVCQSLSVLLSDPVIGGTWTSGSSAATVSSGGSVTGISSGIATISYSVTNACGTTYATMPIVVNPSVVPSVNIAASPGTVLCTVASPVTFSSTSVNGGTAPVYDWSVNGVYAGSGPTYVYTPASGDLVVCKLTSNAVCPVPDTVSTHVNMLITSLFTPSLTITADQNDTLCAATVVTYSVAPVYGGSAPTYLWTKNSASVGTGPTYSTSPADGDIIRCRMMSSMSCLTSSYVLSNTYVMHVQTGISNTVAIHATQPVHYAGTADTFYAVAPHGGAAPIYQWYVDGAVVPGETGTFFITSSLTPGQIVTCSVYSSDLCADPRIALSSGITIATVTSVREAANVDYFTLSPNPNNGTFTVTGRLTGGDGEATIHIVNMIGQTIVSQIVPLHNGLLNDQIVLGGNIGNGVYLLHVKSNGMDQVIRFTLTR